MVPPSKINSNMIIYIANIEALTSQNWGDTVCSKSNYKIAGQYSCAYVTKLYMHTIKYKNGAAEQLKSILSLLLQTI